LAFIVAAVFLSILASASAADSASGKSNEAAIRATADAFANAFDQGNAKAVAALWTEIGTLVDDSGRTFKGRKTIENEYAEFFREHPGVRIQIAVQSIDFPVPNVAIEEGLARAIDKVASSAAMSRYTAVHILQDGKWLMTSVRESNLVAPSGDSGLQTLAWMVGKWEAKSTDATLQTQVRWSDNRRFLHRDYSVRKGGAVASSGTQIIGWDPQARRIRSWSFDSSGGYGSGLWNSTPDGWRIETIGTLADGTPCSSQDFLIRVAGEDGVWGWRSTDRKVGQAILPDTNEVVLDRTSEPKLGAKK
jgi:uncharacterized protein (TIGR02246 family)